MIEHYERPSRPFGRGRSARGAAAGPPAPTRWGQRILLGALLSGVVTSAAHAQYRGDLSTIVLDNGTGQVLQQSGADVQRFPASLTKLMTLYMVFEALRDRRIRLDEAVPVSDHAAAMEPSKLGLLPGSYITVEEAVLALVTKSANDAASALGEMLGGDEDRFGQMMTLRARALGMTHSTFRNASGLPDPDQVTTASDLALLARHLIADFPDDYHYFSVPEFWFHGRLIPNHDPMLRSYPGADGLKTGFTDAAGCNLVTSAVRGNVRLVGVVLGASNNIQRSAVMTTLLNGGFASEGVPVPTPMPEGPRRHRLPTQMLVADTFPSASSEFASAPAADEAADTWRHHRLVRRVLAIAERPRRHGFRMGAAHATPVRAETRIRQEGAPHHGRRHLHRLMARAGRDHAAVEDALLRPPGPDAT